jgi:hypothetical protein
MSSLVQDEPEILSSILDSSVRNNKRRGISGMMLYSEGNVMQVLEGESDAVRETFQTILLDVRHRGIFVLIEEEIESRNFASWSMGFRQLTKADLESFRIAADIFRVREEEIAQRVKPSQARIVLRSFSDGALSIV